jgi:predicted nucleotidyltransferase
VTALPISPVDHRAIHQYMDRVLALPTLQIEAVVLFGSRARGDAGPESDLDLMIILSDDTLPQREQLHALVFDVLLESGVYLSTQILSAELFRQLPARRPLFYANLIRDGIVLYARPDVSLPEFTRRVELLAVA